MRKGKKLLIAAMCMSLALPQASALAAEDYTYDVTTETTTEVYEEDPVSETVSVEEGENEDEKTTDSSTAESEEEDETDSEMSEAASEFLGYVTDLVSGVKDSDTAKKAGFTEISPETEDELVTGDVMINEDGTVLVYISESDMQDGLTSWYTVSDGELTECPDGKYTAGSTFLRHEKETPLIPVVSSLTATYGTMLYDVPLPAGYEWESEDVLLQNIGECEYEVTYTPANTVRYTFATGTVKIDVTKIKKEIKTVPEDLYTISYYKGNTLSAIVLPDGWAWEKPDSILDVGIKTYKAVYEGSDKYDYTNDEKEIDVRVTKSRFAIDEINITVTKGTKLTNSLLPTLSEGTLKWTNKGEKVSRSCVKTCKFIPKDSKHYIGLTNISVTVNVVEKAAITNNGSSSGKQTSKDVNTNTDKSSSGTTTNKTTNKKNKITVISKSSEKKTDASKAGTTTTKTTDKKTSAATTASVSDGSSSNKNINVNASSSSGGGTSGTSASKSTSASGSDTSASSSIKKSSVLPEINLTDSGTAAENSTSAGKTVKLPSTLNKLDLSGYVKKKTDTYTDDTESKNSKKNNTDTPKSESSTKTQADTQENITTESTKQEKSGKKEDSAETKSTEVSSKDVPTTENTSSENTSEKTSEDTTSDTSASSESTEEKENASKEESSESENETVTEEKSPIKKYGPIVGGVVCLAAAAYFAIMKMRAGRLRR